MRATAVKAAIIAAVEGITTLDSDVGGEAFVEIDFGGKDPGRLQDRAFMLQLADISPTDVTTHDYQRVTYLLRIFYGIQQDVDDRIAGDAERLLQALYPLHSTSGETDLYAVEFDSITIQDAGLEGGMLEAALPITVHYRLTGV